MSFVAPLWLAAAAAVAIGVVVAHLFTATVPPQDLLPTVRFVPESAPSTVLRSRRITDWLLLAIRVLTVAAIGLALSGAHMKRSAPGRVVLLDVSRAVAAFRSSLDSVAALGDAEVIVFDSTARAVARDGLSALSQSAARGSVSAGVAAAHRLVAKAADGREQTELVVVSPFVREEVDSATAALLAMWDGPVRLVRVAAAPAPRPLAWEMRTTGDDPVAASLAALPRPSGVAGVRIVRAAPTRADSAFALSGGALVVWPTVPRGVLQSRGSTDSVEAVSGGGHVVVASFAREFVPRAGVVTARWPDGEPAAAEHSLGAGCVREVAIPVDAIGDVALRPSFKGLTASLIAPCGGVRDFTVVDAALTASDRGKLRSTLPSVSISPPVDSRSLPIWFALLAAALLTAEQLLRNRRRAA
jgi:hypothetical protein